MTKTYTYCVGEGSYSSRRVIGAFLTEAERTAWLERQAAGLQLEDRITVKYHNPSAAGYGGTHTTYAPVSAMGPPPPPPAPYWHVNDTYGEGDIFKKFPTEKKAQKYRKKVLKGEVIPFVDFLPYWTQDVPIWDVDHTPKRYDE